MPANSYWTTAAQAWRVAVSDTKIIGRDILYGLAYVVFGFIVVRDDSDGIIIPSIMFLMFTVGYMAHRLCSPEGDVATAGYFANLPRSRTLAYWVHVCWLLLFALIMELVIYMIRALFLEESVTWSSDQLGLAAQPFLTIAVAVWAFYMSSNKLVVALIVFGAIVLANVVTTYTESPVILIIAAAFLLTHAGLRWKQIQIGELT